MLKLVRNKFSQPYLTKLLLETGDEHLVEGNDYQDRFWGCVKSRDGDWIGKNHLGRILMQVRDELKCLEEMDKLKVLQ